MGRGTGSSGGVTKGCSKVLSVSLWGFARSCFCVAICVAEILGSRLVRRPVIGVLLPLAVAATYDAFAYASHNLSSNVLWRGYGSRLHRWLNDNKQQAMLLSAVSEVSLGFLTLFGLLSPARSFTQVILTWNILKQR